MFFKQGSPIERSLMTATSGGTLTLTNTSETYQVFTGTTTHTMKLPDATTMPNGRRFEVVNSSTGTITVQDTGSNTVDTVTAGASKIFRLADNSTANGSWDATLVASAGTAGLSAQESAQFQALAAKSFSQTSAVVPFNPEEISGNFWTTKSGLSTAKSVGTAISFNGYLYATGGSTGGSGATTTENIRYADDSNFWLVKGVIPTAKHYSANFVLNGFAYNLGGATTGGISSTSGFTADSQKYNDATDTWSALTNPLPSVSYQPMGFTSGSGYGFVHGGYNGSNAVSTLYMYNDTALVWYTRTSSSTARDAHAAFVLNGQGIVSHGFNGSTYPTFAERFNEFNNVWQTLASFTTGGRSFVGSFSANGSGFVSGGSPSGSGQTNILDQFNDNVSVWTARAAQSNSLQGQFANSLNNLGYSIGGYNGSSVFSVNEQYQNSNFLKTTISYRTTAAPSAISASAVMNSLVQNVPLQLRTDGDSWKSIITNGGSSTKTGETLATKFAPATQVYVAGGRPNSTSTTAVMEKFDETNNAWLSRQSMPTGRYYGANFPISGYSYSVGGDNSNGVDTSTNERYDEVLNLYTVKTGLTAARAFMAGFWIRDKGYVEGTGVTPKNSQYNAITDSWLDKTAVGTGDYLSIGVAYLDKGYLFGGEVSGTASRSAEYSADTDTWTNKANTPTAREYYSNSWSLNGYAYTAGGDTAPSSSTANSGAYRYDRTTDSWATMGSLGTAVFQQAAVRAYGYGYMIGGRDTAASILSVNQRFTDGVNTWTSRTAMTTARTNAFGQFAGSTYNYELRLGVPGYYTGVSGLLWATKASMSYTGASMSAPFTVGSKVYGAAGFTAISAGNRDNKSQVYDTVLDVWYREIDYPISVSGASNNGSSSTAIFGMGYGFGGDNGSTFANAYRFDTELHTWTSITNLPVADSGPTTFALNGVLYLEGGAAQNSTMKQYNTQTAAYTTKTSSSNHAYGAGGPLNGFGYATGCGTPGLTAVHEAYNDSANTWLTRTNIPVSIEPTGGCIILNGTYFVAGGYTGAPSSNTYGYKDVSNVWALYATLPTPSYGSSCGTVTGTGYLAGGYNGSVYTTATYAFVNSVKQALLSASINVTDTPTTAPLVAATGGTITTVGDYKVHTFTSSGNFVISSADSGAIVEVLAVAGGGGGSAGGGGGGGVVHAFVPVTAGTIVTTVGAGGASRSSGHGDSGPGGSNGGNSIFGNITAIGGGGGGATNDNDDSGTSISHALGATGGSSGGGGSTASTNQGSANAFSGQGNNGGIGSRNQSVASGWGGGGGGAGGAGGNANGSSGGNGGSGLAFNITGSSVTYAGGGGGSCGDSGGSAFGSGGSGGSGGGGNGGTSATSGTNGLGGGGGGSTGVGGFAGAGGSGVVIIRYRFQ